MKYEILLFDLDGTLLDFDKSEIEAFKKLLSRKSLICTKKSTKGFGVPMKRAK